MKVFVLANEVAELHPGMTTARLAVGSAAMGVETLIAELGAFAIDENGNPTLRARPAPVELRALGALPGCGVDTHVLAAGDVILVRLNPARKGSPVAVEFALFMLRFAARAGVRVINTADSIERTANKGFLSELPGSLRPAQAVAQNLADALSFVERLGPELVIKPARGSRGAGVALIDARVSDPRVHLESLLEHGAVVIQERLPSEDGADKRVLLVDGAPLEAEGQIVAIRRVPAEGEFRSNLHAGGSAEAASLDAQELALIEVLRPYLVATGVRLAGLDILAGRVLEINVWAPGGLGPFAQVSGVDAAPALLHAVLHGPS